MDVATVYYIVGIPAAILGIYGYLEHRTTEKSKEEKTFKLLDSPKKFYEKSQEIHTYPQVQILSKTAGLILPSERDSPFKQKYFGTILSRLADPGNYRLDYLFDKANFESELNQYKQKGDYAKIKETKEMILQVIEHTNLDLRCGKTEPLMGMVIGSRGLGSESKATVGLNEEPTKSEPAKSAVEGVFIASQGMIKILVAEYTRLFNEAEKIKTPDDIDRLGFFPIAPPEGTAAGNLLFSPSVGTSPIENMP